MDEILRTIAAVKNQLDARLSAQETRLAAVESRPTGLRYRGVWSADALYLTHDGCTCKGSLWVALSDHPTNTPGEGPGWQLACKKGTDARHGTRDE